MAIGDQDGGRVAVAIPGMLAGSILQTVHFLRGQIFPLPQIGVARLPAGFSCPFARISGSRLKRRDCHTGFATLRGTDPTVTRSLAWERGRQEDPPRCAWS